MQKGQKNSSTPIFRILFLTSRDFFAVFGFHWVRNLRWEKNIYTIFCNSKFCQFITFIEWPQCNNESHSRLRLCALLFFLASLSLEYHQGKALFSSLKNKNVNDCKDHSYLQVGLVLEKKIYKISCSTILNYQRLDRFEQFWTNLDESGSDEIILDVEGLISNQR